MMGVKARVFQPMVNTSLEDLVPADHFYRHVERSLDLSFVRDLVRDLYSAFGRPSIDPVVFFKLQLVMFFEGIRSERQLEYVGSDRLSVRWYLGYDLNQYDEWGGFFDHVTPSPAPIPPADAAAGNQDGLRGFRVPCLVIAPWARRAFVATDEYDHTSILKMIEWRWNLQPLSVRDETAGNLAEVLDFSQRQLSAPLYPVPFGPFGTPCPSSSLIPQQEDEWVQLRSLAHTYGWPQDYKVALPVISR